MPGHLYIISGSSGSGKTTLVDLVLQNCKNVARAPKYSERPNRGAEDDTTHVDAIEAADFDIAYVINDHFYGVRSSEIEAQLDKGENVFIVLSDFRVVRSLKAKFPGRSTAVYVSSAVDPQALQRIQAKRHPDDFQPDPAQSAALRQQFYQLQCSAQLERWPRVLDAMNELLDQWGDVVPHAESTRIRAEKIRSFHLRYTDQITLFDHVVLNHSQDRPDEMLLQMQRLMESRRVRPDHGKPVIFVVAAASGAGKGMLLETTGRLIGPSRVSIVPKEALRDPKAGDRRDGMIALGKGAEFSDEFDFQWEFHKGEHGSGTPYAISTDHVQTKLDEGVNQMVVANIGVFARFAEKFGEHCVFVYLHATRPASEVREYQYANCATPEEAERRIAEITEVHETYIENIWRCDHVLLNTNYREDLFDQMLALVDHYDPAVTG